MKKLIRYAGSGYSTMEVKREYVVYYIFGKKVFLSKKFPFIGNKKFFGVPF